MRDFRKYDVWKISVGFAKNIYQFTSQLPNKEKYNLISQIERASVSISSNIAEGTSRNSEKDFARYIEIALGSAFECENLLILSVEFGYSTANQVSDLMEEIHTIQRMLNNLYGKLTGQQKPLPTANS
jgi:four helix bundle protein